MPNKIYPEDLLEAMFLADDSQASDGVWQAMIEDAVSMYNTRNHTDYNTYDAWLWYIQSDWRVRRFGKHKEIMKNKK